MVWSKIFRQNLWRAARAHPKSWLKKWTLLLLVLVKKNFKNFSLLSSWREFQNFFACSHSENYPKTKLIENDVLKVDILKMKDFYVYRNFWCQVLTQIKGSEYLKMDLVLQHKYICQISVQDNQNFSKAFKIWCHSKKEFRTLGG